MLKMVAAKPDCTGQRFGYLVVLGKSGRHPKNNKQLWKLGCDCGNIIEKPRSDFATHKNISCGCQKRLRQIELNKRRAKPDCTGQRFGMLVVLGKGSSHPKHGRMWKVQCDCGRIVEATRSNLDSGRQVSCGCRKKQILIDCRRPIDISGQRFGKLQAIALTAQKDKYNQPTWRLQCDCGNTCKLSLKTLNRKCRYNLWVNCGDRSKHPENYCSYPAIPNPYPKEAGKLLEKYLHLTELNYQQIDSQVEDEKRDRILRACWIVTYRRSQGEEISELYESRFIKKLLRYCSIDVFWQRKIEQHGGLLYNVSNVEEGRGQRAEGTIKKGIQTPSLIESTKSEIVVGVLNPYSLRSWQRAENSIPSASCLLPSAFPDKKEIGNVMTDATSLDYPVIETSGINFMSSDGHVPKRFQFKRR